MFWSADDEHFVISEDFRIAVGNDCLAAAEDRNDAKLDFRHVRSQLADPFAGDHALRGHFHRHHLHPARGEIEHLEGAGKADQAGDVFGHDLFRADQYVNRHGLKGKQPVAAQVFVIAHAGNFRRRVEHRVGDLAGHHVGLIAVGHRDDHVRVPRACLIEHRRMGPGAVYGLQVQPLLEVAQDRRIAIDYRNIIGFTAKIGGYGRADLTCPENNDLHDFISIPSDFSFL